MFYFLQTCGRINIRFFQMFSHWKRSPCTSFFVYKSYFVDTQNWQPLWYKETRGGRQAVNLWKNSGYESAWTRKWLVSVCVIRLTQQKIVVCTSAVDKLTERNRELTLKTHVHLNLPGRWSCWRSKTPLWRKWRKMGWTFELLLMVRLPASYILLKSPHKYIFVIF